MIIALAVTSLNGNIAQSPQDNTSWTSIADKQHFVETTSKAGNLIIGRKTWDTIQQPLANRHIYVMTRNPNNYKNSDKLTFTNLEPKLLVTQLKKSYPNLIIAGGQEIYSLFLKQQLIDQLWITIEPILFQSPHSKNFISKHITQKYNFRLLNINKLNQNSLLLKYSPKKI